MYHFVVKFQMYGIAEVHGFQNKHKKGGGRKERGKGVFWFWV